MNVIDLKTVDEPLSETKRIMHATVSETYISLTASIGDKSDQLKFIFFEWDDKATAAQI